MVHHNRNIRITKILVRREYGGQTWIEAIDADLYTEETEKTFQAYAREGSDDCEKHRPERQVSQANSQRLRL